MRAIPNRRRLGIIAGAALIATAGIVGIRTAALAAPPADPELSWTYTDNGSGGLQDAEIIRDTDGAIIAVRVAYIPKGPVFVTCELSVNNEVVSRDRSSYAGDSANCEWVDRSATKVGRVSR